MLIVISDLHFSDGTSSRNVSHRAFSHFFEHIKRGLKDENKEIIVVFAGDTFDLLRSDYWMTVKDDEKPWSNDKPYQQHLKNILNNTISANNNSLEIIRQAQNLFNVPVRMHIIPGNHDKMLVEIDGYKDILNEHLGNISITDGLYENKDYCVGIRHGHEYDAYNFEDGGIPIGDVNTVELFVKLPFLIKKQFPELDDELRCVEDIRPQWRTFDYLGATYPEGEINHCIEEATGETIDRFLEIPYVKKWMAKHDTANPFDDADKIQYVLQFFRHLPSSWAERFLKVFARLEIGDHHYEDMAEKEKTLYTVYGHTHTENISFLGIAPEGQHRYYINSGTWRERIEASNSGIFSRYKTLTYVIFYTREERHTEFPSFELWNGALRE